MSLKDELQTILSGTDPVAKGTAIQAIAGHLRKSKATGINAEKKEFLKKQEAKTIVDYSLANQIFLTSINKSRFIAEGAEQKVFLEEDGRYVIKLNDSIFYITWEDYFNSLLLHNYFFSATAYELIGFYLEAETLYAVVRQPYILSTDPTDENKIKEFMIMNGFANTRNNDYFNKDLGIIIEDLHDENVLTSTGVLFFIDTVFYLTKEFYQ